MKNYTKNELFEIVGKISMELGISETLEELCRALDNEELRDSLMYINDNHDLRIREFEEE